MNRKDYNPSPYEKKIAELHGKVEIEAKNLQDVLDSTITAKTELTEQVERKARLNREIVELNEKIKEDTDVLQQSNEQVASYLGKAAQVLKEEKILLENFRKEAQEEMKNLDSTKTYLTDLYGKIATYTRVAQETLKYVNQHLEETGTPINFGLLPDEIVNITLDNFTEKLNV